MINSGTVWRRCMIVCTDWPRRRVGSCSRRRRGGSRGRCSPGAHRSWCTWSWLICAGCSRNPGRTHLCRRRRTPRWIRRKSPAYSSASSWSPGLPRRCWGWRRPPLRRRWGGGEGEVSPFYQLVFVCVSSQICLIEETERAGRPF